MTSRPGPPKGCIQGFSIIEILMVLLVGTIIAAMAIPTYQTMRSEMGMNSMASAIAGAISQTRYAAIMKSQIYTLAIATPANTYVVTNVSTGVANSSVPLPSSLILLNGGTSATYTFTLCPNGTVYGAGGACPGNNAPPAISETYQGRQTNVSVSGVGNVSTTTIN